MSAIPEGFSEILRLSPFNALVGPLYERRAGKIALGYAMPSYTEEPRRSGFVTAHLSLDYAGSAFANCYHPAEGERIVRASAIFARAGKEQ
jgi:hypothetical protein